MAKEYINNQLFQGKHHGPFSIIFIDNHIIYVLIYVDDMVITGYDQTKFGELIIRLGIQLSACKL